jgi:tetratricopeptide (TPR) repeat protein
MRIAYDFSHNPRQGARLAVYLDEASHTDEAKQILYKILEKHPDYSVARFRLLMFMERANDWTAINAVARDGVKYNPDEGIYYFFYGESLMRMGDTRNGLEMFRKSKEFSLPAEITAHVDEVLKQYSNQLAPPTTPPPAKK